MDFSWTQDEIVKVLTMWALVEDVYEEGVEPERLMASYRDFKSVVKSIGEERSLGREFEAVSGYSLYRVMEKAKKNDSRKIKL